MIYISHLKKSLRRETFVLPYCPQAPEHEIPYWSGTSLNSQKSHKGGHGFVHHWKWCKKSEFDRVNNNPIELCTNPCRPFLPLLTMQGRGARIHVQVIVGLWLIEMAISTNQKPQPPPPPQPTEHEEHLQSLTHPKPLISLHHGFYCY